VTEPVIAHQKSMFRLVLIAGFAMSLAGCSHLPLLETDSPTEPTEKEPTAVESEPDAEPETRVQPRDEPGPDIAVGASARDNLYASLAAGGQALAPEDVGYFLDVHEARLRPVLAGSPIRMQRTDDRLLLTIPGSLSFETDSAKVVEGVEPMLSDLAAVLVEFDKTLVSVLGNTDDRGDAAYNQSLSERRAVAVALILKKMGVARERLVGIGFGQERPAIEGDTETARTANRRIEILIEPVIAGS